jgi:hypothetical protein
MENGDSVVSGAQEAVEKAQRSWTGLKSRAGAARDRIDDGLDLARDAGKSLSGFVERQPLMAIAAAFLVGYMAAWALRKVSS